MNTIFNFNDGYKTKIHKWDVEDPKYIMQIVHGSGEHAARYEKFGRWLNANGVSVWAMDLRGHGEMAKNSNTLGYFGKGNNTKKLISDIHHVMLELKEAYPGKETVLLGHSMGSFLVRMYAKKFNDFEKLIVIGTNNQNRTMSFMNYLVTKTFALFAPKKRSQFINKLSYKKFNAKLNIKGDYPEWISTDKSVVKKFSEDELCGFVFTNKGFSDMAYWINKIAGKKVSKNVNSNFEALFLAGEMDPVGDFGKQVRKAYHLYSKFGIHSEIILYPNMRHEVLNEVRKREVWSHILKFIEDRGENGY